MNYIELEEELKKIIKLYEEDKIDEVIEGYNALLRKYKDEQTRSLINFQKGLAYHKNCNYEKAIDSYEEALKTCNYIEPLIQEYEIYNYKNELENALSTIDRMIEISPELFYGYDLKFNFLFNLSAYDEAEKVISITEKLFEESSIITINKVKVYVMTKRFEEALNIINKEISNKEIHYDLLVEKAKILVMEEKIEEALKILKEVHNIFKENTEIIYMLGTILMINGQVEDANMYLKKLLEIEYSEEFSYVLGLYYYGIILKKIENKEKAGEYFKWLYRRYNVYGLNYPNDLNIMLLKSAILYELQNYEESLRLLDKLNEINSAIIEIQFFKYLIYKATGEIERAREAKLKLQDRSEFYTNILAFIEEGGSGSGK